MFEFDLEKSIPYNFSCENPFCNNHKIPHDQDGEYSTLHDHPSWSVGNLVVIVTKDCPAINSLNELGTIISETEHLIMIDAEKYFHEEI